MAQKWVSPQSMNVAQQGHFLEKCLEILSSYIKSNSVPLVCTKCNAEVGTIFCDRSLLGEEGACDFKPKGKLWQHN